MIGAIGDDGHGLFGIEANENDVLGGSDSESPSGDALESGRSAATPSPEPRQGTSPP